MSRLRKSLDTLRHDNVESNPPNAGKALRSVIDQQTSRQGKKLVILLIGRNSYDDLVGAVEAAKQADISVITLYIGGIEFENTNQLSTQKYGSIEVPRMYDLLNMEYEILELICDQSEPGTTPAPTTPAPKVWKPCKVDLVFVVDDIYRHTKIGLRSLYYFLVKTSKLLPFDDSNTRVGLISFGKKPRSLFRGMIESEQKFMKTVRRRLRPKPASKPIAYSKALVETSNILERYGREQVQGTKRLAVLILSRQGKNYLTPELLRKYLGEGLFISSVTTDDASSIPVSSLTNIDHHIDAYR